MDNANMLYSASIVKERQQSNFAFLSSEQQQWTIVLITHTYLNMLVSLMVVVNFSPN